jgi:DNA topoisomerase-1
LNGRWGPYIRMNKTNFKIPKETNVDNLSREDCILIIEKNDSKRKKSPKKSVKKS